MKLITILKISFSLLLITVLFIQYADSLDDVLSRLISLTSIFLLLVASTFHLADKFLRVWNLKIILEKDDVSLSYIKLLKISLVSMFFGFFLPGGSGPDIARVVQLRKHANGMAKPASATLWLNILAVVAASVMAIASVTCAYFVNFPLKISFMKVIIVLGFIVIIAFSLLLNKKIQK